MNGKFSRLAEWFEKHEPKGRWAWLGSTYDAFRTFTFTPNRVTKQGCHVRDAVDLKRAMITVVIALIPAMLFGMWNIGYQHYHAVSPSLNSQLSTFSYFWYCLFFVRPRNFTFASARGIPSRDTARACIPHAADAKLCLRYHSPIAKHRRVP